MSIRERDLGVVSPAPTDMVRIVRGGQPVMGPAASLPVSAAAQRQIDDLRASQGSGLPGYETVADLPDDLLEADAGLMAWVSNDSTLENNGAWRWNGEEWVRSADLTSELTGRVSTVEAGGFTELSFSMKSLHPWTGYGWGVQGSNGRFPLAIRLDGTVETTRIHTAALNDIGVETLDAWTGYLWALGGSNGRHPIAVGVDGVVHAKALAVETVNGLNASDAIGTRLLVAEDASQEWWIGPVHTTLRAPYERIVSGLYGSAGEILVTEFVPGLGLTKRIHVATTAAVDDHNSPALWAMDGRRAVLAWTEHNETTRIDLRISTQDGDIASLLYAPAVSIDLGVATSYTQIHRVESESTDALDVFWMFTRTSSVNWTLVRFSVDQADGTVSQIGSARTLFVGDGQYYITSAPANNAVGNQVIRIAAGYNPAAALNSVHYYEIDAVTGTLTTPADSTSANVLTGAGLPLAPADVAPVLAQTDGATDRRLFYVRPGPVAPAIAYAEWPLSDPDDATYKVAVYGGGTWTARNHGSAGPRFGYTADANYIAGVSFPDPCYRDTLLVAYRDVGNAQDVLEEHATVSGTTAVRELARRTDGRIARPIVPRNGSPLCLFSSLTSYGATWFTFTGTVRSAIRG